jgi:hypothetical protein
MRPIIRLLWVISAVVAVGTSRPVVAENEQSDYIDKFEKLRVENESLRRTSPTNYWAVFNLATVYSELYAYYSSAGSNSTLAAEYWTKATNAIEVAMRRAPNEDLKVNVAINYETVGLKRRALAAYKEFLNKPRQGGSIPDDLPQAKAEIERRHISLTRDIQKRIQDLEKSGN